MKNFKGKAISSKTLKFLCLGICLVGFILLIVMKKAMKLSNIVCFVTFLAFMIAGLFGYWMVDRKSKGKSTTESEIDDFLKSFIDSLKGGQSVSNAIESCEESSSRELRDSLESFFRDSTGPLLNSNRRDMLDLIKLSMDDSSTKSLVVSLKASLKKSDVKGDCSLGYVALGSFAIELAVIAICIYMTSI